MTVKVRNNNVDAALKVFRRRYSERVFEFKQRQEYEKPSTQRAKAKASAKARERKRRNEDKLRSS